MGQSGTMHLDSVYCAKTDLGFFAFSWTQLVEVVMRQVGYAKRQFVGV